MITRLFAFVIPFFICLTTFGQQALTDEENLKKQVLALQQEVDHIQINLSTSERKFKRGILVATLGYTLTITGGMMLGRENDKVGQGLLIAGGATGAVGTVLMLDSFKYLGRAGRGKRK